MESGLEKEVRFLKVYAIAATFCCVVFIASAFTLQSRKQKFEEIDVERINIVEKDGKLRMVISNQERQHPGIVITHPDYRRGAALLERQKKRGTRGNNGTRGIWLLFKPFRVFSYFRVFRVFLGFPSSSFQKSHTHSNFTIVVQYLGPRLKDVQFIPSPIAG